MIRLCLRSISALLFSKSCEHTFQNKTIQTLWQSHICDISHTYVGDVYSCYISADGNRNLYHAQADQYTNCLISLHIIVKEG